VRPQAPRPDVPGAPCFFLVRARHPPAHGRARRHTRHAGPGSWGRGTADGTDGRQARRAAWPTGCDGLGNRRGARQRQPGTWRQPAPLRRSRSPAERRRERLACAWRRQRQWSAAVRRPTPCFADGAGGRPACCGALLRGALPVPRARGSRVRDEGKHGAQGEPLWGQRCGVG